MDANANGVALHAELIKDLPPPRWSRKRWVFILMGGPTVIHRVPTKRKAVKRGVLVETHRLAPRDVTRYRGWRLREIRASAKNFLGELRR